MTRDPASRLTAVDDAQGSGVAVASIIVSMGLTGFGNGLMFSYIPISLGAAGYPPVWAAIILTALSVGGLAGCFLTGAMVRRGGHARAFMIFSALIILNNAAVATGVNPPVWVFARVLYGFAVCGLFIVAQSWLNDAVTNRVRGRVMAIFYVTYIVSLGFGSLTVGQLDISTNAAPIAGIIATALAALPVGLTRLAQPPVPETASVALRQAWRVSPVGVAGMLAIGGLAMMMAFAPIHATASGYGQSDVALLMFAMPLGTLFVQIPLGWVSDRTDRRYVLVAAAVLVAIAGATAAAFDGAQLAVLVAIYMIWNGACESIYSLSSAHAGDRASKEEMVALQSTMLFAWSLAGFVVPTFGTVLTGIYGTASFIYIAIVIGVAYAIFVLWRIMQALPVPSEETGSFTPMSAQAPLPVEPSLPSEVPLAR